MAPCACCRCCRRCPIWCCCSERFNAYNLGTKKKVFLLSLFLVYVGVVIADLVYAARFRTDINAGAKSLICETFRLTDNALNGFHLTTTNPDGSVTDNSFIGAENVAATVHEISDLVDSDSPIISSILAVVDTTKDIQFAVSDFLAHLDNMNSILGDPSNMVVGKYKCIFCEVCCGNGASSQVGTALAAIESSVASALVEVRRSIKEKLTGDGLQGIRDSLDSASDMVDGFKTQFEEQIGKNLIDQKPMFEQAVSYVDLATLIVMCVITLPTLLLFLTVCLGVFKSDRPSYSNPQKKPQNPCHASCGWCLSFILGFILFLIAGILGALAYMEASTCDMVSDMDSFITLGVSRLGVEEGGQMETILRTCLTPSGSGDILGSVDVGDGKTARDMLDISGTINAQFDMISAGLDSEGGGLPKFSEDPAILALLDAVRDFGALYVIPADVVGEITSDSAYTPSMNILLSETPETIAELTRLALAGVPSCADKVGIPLTGDAGKLLRDALTAAGFPISPSDETVDLPGISSYFAGLQSAGISIGETGSVCPSDFDDLGTSSTSHPFESYMSFKTDVLAHTFRCDTITVAEDPDTADAVVLVNPVSCSWSEWITYVGGLHANLIAKAQTIDAVQETVIDGIQTELRAIVQEDVLPVINRLADGLNCKFLQVRWNGIYESLCWKQTPGLAGTVICWLVFGWLCAIAILIEFVIWRHLKDNISIWRDAVEYHEGGDHDDGRGDGKKGGPADSMGNSKEGTMIQISPDGHVMVVANKH